MTDGLTGKRIRLNVDEPTTFAQAHDDTRFGLVVRLLTLRNVRGEPYGVAVVRLDRPLSYLGRSSEIVSLMTRYAKHELEDILRKEAVVVNVALEDPGILEWDAADPRLSSPDRVFHLGYGTASLD